MRVLVVDDHPLYRAGLKTLLPVLDPAVEVSDAADVREAVALASTQNAFDLVLLDMNLPGANRLAALEQVKTAFEGACLVVVSAEEDPALILQVIEAGATGYIPKTTDPAVMTHALRLVLAQGIYLPPVALRLMAGGRQGPSGALLNRLSELTDRQRAVLDGLVKAKPNKVIARELGIAEGTVKMHLNVIYQTLHVASRMQAMALLHELEVLGRLP